MSNSFGPRRVVAATLMATMALSSWASCTTRPTEIVGGVTTQIRVPKFLQQVGVVVQSGGQLVFCQSYEVVDGAVTLPSTLGALPPEDAEGTPSEPVTMQILGFRSTDNNFKNDCLIVPEAGEDNVFVVRRRRVTYVGDKIAYLPLPLRESCTGVACPEDETCIGGLCESMDVNPDELPEYDPAFVFGNTNTCFDLGRCMPQALLAPAVLTNADDCTFRLLWPDDAPAPEPGNVNVRLVYDSFGVEVLDLDDKEGFVFPDVNDPLTFRLASNMCEGVFKQGRILSVAGAALCPAKRALQPICDDDLKQIQDGLYGLIDDPTNDFCAQQGGELQPAESALYILMLKSDSMSEYFGPDGLAFAVETPLQNPIALRTKVAFSFLPASTCDPNIAAGEYQTPAIGFGVVDDVREPIGQALLDDTSLPTDGDLNLEPAMSGAYLALGVHDTDPPGGVFNRKALLILGNRDVGQACNGIAQDASTQAANALALPVGIHTYVAGLPFNDVLPTDYEGIAVSGGTTYYAGEGDAAAGVNEIINDLGSCLYEAPNPAIFDGGNLPDPAKVSYLDPITQQRTDISVDASCNAANQDTANGFNQDGPGGPIRICGAACQTLRDTLTTASGLFALQGFAAPRIPIQISVPCVDATVMMQPMP